MIIFWPTKKSITTVSEGFWYPKQLDSVLDICTGMENTLSKSRVIIVVTSAQTPHITAEHESTAPAGNETLQRTCMGDELTWVVNLWANSARYNKYR